MGWQRRAVSSAGFVNTFSLDGRGDTYLVENSDAAKVDPTLDPYPSALRGIGTAGLVSSYPLVRRFDTAQAVIEPLAGINLSPNIDQNTSAIPNEDSIDTQFDTSTLFQLNRYPGLDRQEDGGRFNYGIKSGLYGDDGKYGKLFVGQSYRFYGNDIFPAGSGLEDRKSDVVGQMKVGLSQYLDADYRFQFDTANLAAKRHEVQAGGGNDTFRLNTRYLYTAALAGTSFTESREQVQMDGNYKLTPAWKFSSSGLMDLGAQPGLRNFSTGLEYLDECFSFAIQGSRNVANEASGDNETKLLIRIGLKNIGEFSGPQIPLGGTQSNKK
mgnify:CR=1 FL=1